MLKHKRLVSIIATLAFCLSFLAPALLAPAPAVAAGSITALRVESVSADTASDALGTVKVTIPAGSIVSGDVVVFNLPDECEFVTAFGGANNLSIPADVATNEPNSLAGVLQVKAGTGLAGDSSVQIEATGNQLLINDGVFYLYLGDIEIGDIKDGDLTATFTGPRNGFPQGSVVVARTSSSGEVELVASKTQTSNNNFSFDLTIKEDAKESLELGADSLVLTLPDGFEWTTTSSTPTAFAGEWGETTYLQYVVNDEELSIRNWGVGASSSGTPAVWTQGALTSEESAWKLSGLSFTVVDESDAKDGDVIVKVTGKSGLAQSELKVGTYGSYGVKISAKSTPEVFAGQIEQEIGDIVIEETIGESLVDGRYITLTLPSYAKWTKIDTDSDNGINLTFAGNAGSEGNVLKYTIGNSSSGNDAAKLELKDMEVALDVTAPGDLVVTLGGNAGVSGEVTVAKIALPVSIKAEEQEEVKIGVANQKVADLIINESVAGAIVDKINGAQQSIVLKVPAGVEFAKNPTVTVESGDIKLDLSQVRRAKAIGNTQPTDYYQYLIIPVDRDSNTASTIKVSDIYVTVDRTVPEGNLLVALVGGAVLQSNGAYANLQPLGTNGYTVGASGMFPQTAAIGAAAPAKVVTPAPVGGASATFYIGSTIMNVNGSNIIMDVAPYIKAGRTYVPVRYLGDALGATTAWDAATKTVTVTKGDKTVVLVIGSTIAKVNGADVQMDVAPEIVNGRTMLPARWVAEGLGYQVGWNAALQQVVIQ